MSEPTPTSTTTDLGPVCIDLDAIVVPPFTLTYMGALRQYDAVAIFIQLSEMEPTTSTPELCARIAAAFDVEIDTVKSIKLWHAFSTFCEEHKLEDLLKKGGDSQPSLPITTA